MLNEKIAQVLDLIGDYLELDEANPFRIRAIRRGVEIIGSLSDDVAEMDRKSLLALPGIGKGIADIIEEYKTKKTVSELETFQKKYPDGVMDIMNLKGLGPKRAAFLFKNQKIDSIEKLEWAAKANRLVDLPRFGPKLQEAILKTISYSKASAQRILISRALSFAAEMKTYLGSSSAIKDLQVAGSLRRWKETIGDLDFLCTSTQPAQAIDYFVNYPETKQILAKGTTKASLLTTQGLQCDFRVVEKNSLGAALLYFTGSKEHNVRLREIAQKKGLTLNEYGLFKLSDSAKKKPLAAATEQDIYKKLGMAWIPPELREDRGEVQAALENKLPHLIEEKDVQGDIHNHTVLSDGINSLEEMVAGAKKKGWRWFFSADHSPSLIIASGLPERVLRKKFQDVKKLNQKEKDFSVLCSSEVDILVDGKMDYPDRLLKELDAVVASVHTRTSQTRDEMTRRIQTALRNKHVNILGHLTGRLIHRRAPYDLDIDAVLKTAKETQTAIEINGQPDRQELQDIHIKKAVEMGVPLILSTDAHSVEQLDNMTIAVHMARRGWAEKKNILNTLSLGKLKKWLDQHSTEPS